jgi:CheY-like chemotaxis protein
MTNGPIVIVEDDTDDQEIFTESIRAIGIPNELRIFNAAIPALDYLYTTDEQPFIILSDVNMPAVTGLEFKAKIQQDDFLRTKGIPFVFISTNASPTAVRKAHELSVQGYFQKPSNIGETKEMFRKMFEYWELCKHINNT